jgi:hypothetical protein
MATKKYWRNVIKGPFFKDLEPGMTGTSIWAHHNEYKNGTTLGYHCVNSLYQAMETHSHPFHETFVFLGSDPMNINDLHGGEIRVCLGEEKEEQVITSAAAVSIPAGLPHSPVIIKPGRTPIIFMEISTTSGYSSDMDEKMVEVLRNPPDPLPD